MKLGRAPAHPQSGSRDFTAELAEHAERKTEQERGRFENGDEILKFS